MELTATDVYRESRWSLKLRQFALALRIMTGTIFCTSGLLKIINQHEFVEALESFGLFSTFVMEGATLFIPHAEIALGLLLAFGFGTTFVSWSFAVQLTIFTALGAIASLRGNEVDCGCFPIAGTKEAIGIDFFLRNAALIVSCVWIGFRFREPHLQSRELHGESHV